MQCPLCINETLEAHFRGEVEIDMCPRCRGVWLDRGEIDKLAAETVDITRPKSSRSDRNRDRGTWDRDDLPTGEDRDKSDRYNQDRDKKDRKKRRKSFGERLADVLEEIID